jgi:hypothetical protein
MIDISGSGVPWPGPSQWTAEAAVSIWFVTRFGA